MDTGGSNQTNLTNDATSLCKDVHPAFSPDGSRIAFVSHDDNDAEIYVMDADGSNRTNITPTTRHKTPIPTGSRFRERRRTGQTDREQAQRRRHVEEHDEQGGVGRESNGLPDRPLGDTGFGLRCGFFCPGRQPRPLEAWEPEERSHEDDCAGWEGDGWDGVFGEEPIGWYCAGSSGVWRPSPDDGELSGEGDRPQRRPARRRELLRFHPEQPLRGAERLDPRGRDDTHRRDVAHRLGDRHD